MRRRLKRLSVEEASRLAAVAAVAAAARNAAATDAAKGLRRAVESLDDGARAELAALAALAAGETAYSGHMAASVYAFALAEATISAPLREPARLCSLPLDRIVDAALDLAPTDIVDAREARRRR